MSTVKSSTSPIPTIPPPADTALFHLRRAIDQLKVCQDYYPEDWLIRFHILEAETISIAERTVQTIKQLEREAA